jgi:hypothetical protein
VTFIPASNASTNAPGISGLSILSSRFSDYPVWDTDAFDVRIVSTDPFVSEVGWKKDSTVRSVIYYAPRNEED